MDDQKYSYENDEFIFNFKSNEVVKKNKKFIKNKKRKETNKKKENEGKEKEKVDGNIINNKKISTKIIHKYDKYQFVKNRNIIDILSSKQNKSNLGITGEQTTKNSILIESETVENNNNEENTIKNIYDIFNSVQTFSLSNEKSFDNTSSSNNNKNSLINLKIKNNNLVNEHKNNSEEKKQKMQKKWETNILNLTKKEFNENNISSEHKENNSNLKSKFFFDDEVFYMNIKCNYLLKDKKNKNFFIENYFKKDSNTKSYKNILSKPNSIKLNSSELLLNNIKKKNCVLSQNLRKNNNISITQINSNQNKSSLNKTENNCSENYISENSRKRKFNSSEKRKKGFVSKILNDIKTNKSKKKDLSKKKDKIKNIKLKNYYGPIDIGLVSLKNKEESIDDIINKMNKKGFECTKMKDTLIRCIKKKKVIDIEITKIKGDIIYFLAKKLH
jgi:hypothetical protein